MQESLTNEPIEPGRYRKPGRSGRAAGVAFMEVTPSGYAVYHPSVPGKPRYVLGPKSVIQHYEKGMNQKF